ncbi:MAG: hypothetical protein ABIO83_01485, partial [Ilumatobacteraceae bacterium]
MDDHVSLMRTIYDAFARRDITAVVDSLDPHVEWNEAEHVTFWPGTRSPDQTLSSRDSLRASPATFGRSWRIHVERLYACGTTVIMQGRYSGIAQST